MAKETFYKQTTLEKKEGESTITQVSWIPEKFAILNKTLKLKNDDDVWIDGWNVQSVGESRISEKNLPDYRKMIRGHRMSTGDSLRK